MLLGDPLSLVCGTGLDSNPQATVTWTAPNGTTIMDSTRYSLINGPEIVKLDLTRTIQSDAGMWRCDIRTESDHYTVSDGSLVLMNSTTIGIRIQHNIELIILPGECDRHAESIIKFLSSVVLVSHTQFWSKRVRLACYIVPCLLGSSSPV